jgi:error-prone DNA polymerase
MSFVHLHCHSNYSFQDGVASPADLCRRAAEMGMGALAVTDHNGVYGAVKFHLAARDAGIRPIIGVGFTQPAGHKLVLLARNREGYANLCRLATRAHLDNPRRHPQVRMDMLAAHPDGLICLSGGPRGEIGTLLAGGRRDEAEGAARRYLDLFGGGGYYLELQDHLLPADRRLGFETVDLGRRLGVPIVATNDVHYLDPGDHPVHDVLVCMRHLVSVHSDVPDRKRSREYWLKPPARMQALFADYPDAVANTLRVAEQCSVELDPGTYHFPDFAPPDGFSPEGYLRHLCYEGAEHIYGARPGNGSAVHRRLEHELRVICDLGLAGYFLSVKDIVDHARREGIRVSGRGSAADSLVSYVLGITGVDPIKHKLLFERFVNPERRGMPDIDLDFCSRRRGEVTKYVSGKYGRERVAAVANVVTYSLRSAAREVGKALHMPDSQVDRIAKLLPRTHGLAWDEILARFPEVRQSRIPRDKLRTFLELCERIDGCPRNLSVHLGGIVMSRVPLADLTGLELAAKGVVVTQYNKDDVEVVGLVKMDLLGLRTLSAIEDAVGMIRANHGVELDMDRLPLDDAKTYEMLRSTKTVAVFQLESPGMRSLLGRLQPTCFDDVIANISLFRPGPVQADMVTPFVRRRHGEEPVEHFHESIRPILEDTYGVIVYQEQVLEIAHEMAGLPYGVADQFRRAMTSDRSQDEMEKMREIFIRGATARGVDIATARTVFEKLAAFAAYGFCKAHAAAFAHLSYQTAYLKAHYPAEFLAGNLSNQPMGFYPTPTILREARRLGIRILPMDVNRSSTRYTVENGAIRIGLCEIPGIGEREVDAILEAREHGSFRGIAELVSRARLSAGDIEAVIACGAADAFGPREQSRERAAQFLSRAQRTDTPRLLDDDDDPAAREVKSEITGHRSTAVGRTETTGFVKRLAVRVTKEFTAASDGSTPQPEGGWREHVPEGGSREQMPARVDFEPRLPWDLDARIAEMGASPSKDLWDVPDGRVVSAGGVVIRRQRPPTRSGKTVVFVTLEDATGMVDCVIFPDTYERYASVIFASSAMVVRGRMRRRGGKAPSIVADEVISLRLHSDDEEPHIRKYDDAGLAEEIAKMTDAARTESE